MASRAAARILHDKAPYVNRNEYGVSLGGPVIIPKLYNGRNRTFFFFNWEATQVRHEHDDAHVGSDGRRCATAISAGWSMRKAGSSTCTIRSRHSATGSASRSLINGVANTIDPARISPVAKFLFDHTALPTHPEINPLVDANWIGRIAAAARSGHPQYSRRPPFHAKKI